MAINTSRAHPSKELAGGMVAVPTSATSATTVDTFLEQIYVSNTTAGALTLTVTDAAGTAKIVPTFSVAANSSLSINWPSLLFASGGVKWNASGAGLQAELFGYVRGA